MKPILRRPKTKKIKLSYEYMDKYTKDSSTDDIYKRIKRLIKK